MPPHVNRRERRMDRTLLAVVAVTLLAFTGDAWATSQTIVGIVTESDLQAEKPRVTVRVLWDSYGIGHEGVRSIDVKGRWPGCKFRLDGEEVEPAKAVQDGNLVFAHFNRQSLRVVEAKALPKGRLAQLRPKGAGFVVGECAGAVHPKGEGARATNLLLYATIADGKVTGVVAQAPRYATWGCNVTKQKLSVQDGRLKGKLSLTVPAVAGKKPKPELAVAYTVDLPITGGEGTLTGTCAGSKIASRVKVQAVAPAPLPKKAVAWLVIPGGNHIAIPFQDGKPMLEHAYVLFGKGYIVGSVKLAKGALTDSKLTLEVAYESKGTSHTAVLDGPVCGDRVGGTFTQGESRGTFFGGILPADCTWRGYLGHDNSKDIPARNPDRSSSRQAEPGA